jgi:hypothetical protein
VGISWYTWLEQGRDIQVSDQVLSRLAEILRLDAEERCHLFDLARGPRPSHRYQGDESPTPLATYQAILDGFLYPAQLFDSRLNVIAWNESANGLFGDYSHRSERERNVAWSLFMNPAQRERFSSWERAALGCIAFLRALSDRSDDDRWLRELIADLQAESPEFRAWWPRHDILLNCNGSGKINHPLVGHLALQQTILVVPSRPDWQVIVFTPLPEGDTSAKLEALMRGKAHSDLSR